MAAPRKTRDNDSGGRYKLVDAAAQIMREEGYAAATVRRVAARAGVKPGLIYYYFDTMDDLFVAVLRAGADASLARMRRAITADDPLRALWALNTDSVFTQLNTEFMALANHRSAVAAELKAYAERVRDIETAAVTVALRSNGIDLEVCPPLVLAMALAQMGRSLSNEAAIGVTVGHQELRRSVERWLDRLMAKSDEPLRAPQERT